MLDDNNSLVDKVVDEIAESKKYRQLNVCKDTIKDLVIRSMQNKKREKDIVNDVRDKLHNIVANYLGDLNYELELQNLTDATSLNDLEQLKLACSKVMSCHTSTRERLPILDRMYQSIFEITGYPEVILDLACGIHPLAIPWMNLPFTNTRYFAYDIIPNRVAFLNDYLSLIGLKRTVFTQDILVDPPGIEADVAFIFKEVHRFEQRQKGSTVKLLGALHAKYIVVSLPTKNMSGNINFLDSYKKMFYNVLGGMKWSISEILFDSEIFFCIKK